MKNNRLDIQVIKKMYIADIALLFEDLEFKEQEQLQRIIGYQQMALCLIEANEFSSVHYFNQLSKNKQTLILNEMPIDDLKEFLLYFSQDKMDLYLSYFSLKKQKQLKELLAYDVDRAASIMSLHYVTIKDDLSIKKATKQVINVSNDQDFVEDIYVLNAQDELIGIVSLKNLIIARPNERLIDIMDKRYIYLTTQSSIKTAIKKIRDYDLNSIPILSTDQKILGIITNEDILDEMYESYEASYQKMVSIKDHDEDQSAFNRSMSRLPWLIASVAMNLVIASFLSVFQATLQTVVVLVLFQPMILGMAGNIGTQSIAVTILGLYKGEMKLKNHILKELLISIINSIIIGLIGFIIVYLFLTVLNQTGFSIFNVSIVVGLSLMISMFISALAGVFLPIILSKLKLDPATASGPLISTINDFMALGTYFLIATLILMNI